MHVSFFAINLRLRFVLLFFCGFNIDFQMLTKVEGMEVTTLVLAGLMVNSRTNKMDLSRHSTLSLTASTPSSNQNSQ